MLFDLHPLRKGPTLWTGVCLAYLAIFTAYWLWNLVEALRELQGAAAMRSFTTNKLGLSERQLRSVTWPEVAHRIVEVRCCGTLALPAVPREAAAAQAPLGLPSGCDEELEHAGREAEGRGQPAWRCRGCRAVGCQQQVRIRQ